MEERGLYRLLLILENPPASVADWTCRVQLDRGHTWELNTDDPIVALNTEPGPHTIKASVSQSVSRTVNYRIFEGQYVTRVFIRGGANAVDLKVEASTRADPYLSSARSAEPAAPVRAAPAQPARTGRGRRVLGLIAAFLLGVVLTLGYYNFIVLPARAAANPSPSPSQPAETAELRSYAVELRSARRTSDNAGRPTVVVSYAWTNNGNVTASASEVLHGEAFQNGVQLTATTISDPGLYDPSAAMRQLRPGATLEIQAAYVLMDETTAVEFEVSPQPDVSGETVIEELDLAEIE